MSTAQIHVGNFNSGEITPLMGSRFGVDKMVSGCQMLRNFLLHVHGPVFRRPGMEYMGPNTSSASRSHLIAFNFSTTTTFLLELNEVGLRVWSNGVVVPLIEPVATPWTAEELKGLQSCQVNDVVYIVHPNHAPRKLSRIADDNWVLVEMPWKYPPLLDEYFRTALTVPPSAVSLLQVNAEMWREFYANTGDEFRVGWSGGSGTNTINLQKWSGSTWTTVKQFTGTASTYIPAAWILTSSGTYRIQVAALRPGVSGSASVRAPFLPFPTPNPPPIHTVDFSQTQPPSATSVVVPIGSWQVKVDGTIAGAVPSGVSGKVQRWTGSAWADVSGGALTLTPGKVTIFSGTNLVAAQTTRILWAGNAWPNATVSIERIVFPASTDITLETSAVTGSNVNLTASAAKFNEGHVGSYWQLSHRRDNASVNVKALASWTTDRTSPVLTTQGEWYLYTYGTWTTTLYLEAQTPSGGWEVLRSWVGEADRNIIANGTVANFTKLRLRIGNGATSTSSGTPLAKFLLELSDSRIYGIVKIKSITSPTVAVCDVVQDVHSTTPTTMWTEGAFSGDQGYPGAIALHGGRLWLAGTKKAPARIWGSEINDYESFRRSTLDDGSVDFTADSGYAHRIRWMASKGGEILMGTAGNEWTISSEGPVITPTDVMFSPRSSFGSESIQPVMANESLVWAQRGKKKIRRVAPRSANEAWSAAELTTLAEHITGSGVAQMAFTSNPTPMLLVVTEDGRLAAMTYDTEQNVFGWHIHDTDGIIESVAVNLGTPTDHVYFSVNRAGSRTIERWDPIVLDRDFSAPERMMYVDAGKRFTFETPQTSVTGLEHLEGETVSILADGAVVTPRVVTGGAITLPVAASTVIVGLPFTSLLQPSRQELQMDSGTAQGKPWKVARVGLYLHQSLGGEVAATPTSRFEKLNVRRISTPMGSAPGLFTGDIESPVEATSQPNVSVVVRQQDPLPLNIGALVLKVDVYGGT